jgi:hypothetical protein
LRLYSFFTASATILEKGIIRYLLDQTRSLLLIPSVSVPAVPAPSGMIHTPEWVTLPVCEARVATELVSKLTVLVAKEGVANTPDSRKPM